MNIDTQMKTYFPRAKHSNVILEASIAVVSGNFTLISAGYFLSPEVRKVMIMCLSFFVIFSFSILFIDATYIKLFIQSCITAQIYKPSSGGNGMRGMNLEKTLFPMMGLETKQE